MGADPMAVVGSQLRVHGITGLRIADASIMPSRRIPRHSLTRQRSGGHCHDQSEGSREVASRGNTADYAVRWAHVSCRHTPKASERIAR
jgi:GMC oxidoreductase